MYQENILGHQSIFTSR